MPSSIVGSIDRVVSSAIDKYNDIMQSEHVAKNIIIDGKMTKGQVEEKKKQTITEDEYTRTCTCMLDTPVKRGSFIQIENNDKTGYDLGIVKSVPNRTPVDYYFTVLLFNTTAKRYRKQYLYSPDGYVIGDNPLIEDEIPCFVSRVGMRQRQIDVGIDSNAVNQIITSKIWDIQKNDILHIGSERYKITDLRELDKEICEGYMTFYRE